MAKKIKLTETQIKMLKANESRLNTKVVRITESQYNRLFGNKNINENKKPVNEGPITDFLLENFQSVLNFLTDVTKNSSQVGLDRPIKELGITWGEFIGFATDLGILVAVGSSIKPSYRLIKRNLVRYGKTLYNDIYGPTFDEKTGKLIGKGEQTQEEGLMFGDDIEETTTTGSVGGSYEAPMGGQSPIKRDFNHELNEDDLDETTMSGGATGSYEQPKIWAKDKSNWRHGKETMYPDGKIVANEGKQPKKKVIAEALKLQRAVDKDGNRILAVISDIDDKRKASRETFSNKKVLKQGGFNWTGDYWAIPESELETAKKILSTVNKVEYLIDKVEDLAEVVTNSEEGKGTKKELLVANVEQYIMDLANATDEKAVSAEIKRYLTFFANFHQYSFYNRMLIYLQRPEATKVASYKKWKDTNRQVKKGSKGITILVPIFNSKKKEDETEEDVRDNQGGLRGFITGNVFDVSDTEAINADGEIPESPEWHSGNEPSEVADELYGYMSEFASDMNIKITQDDSKGGEKGFSAGDHINLSSDVEGVGKVATLVHEITHELMHWRESSIYYVGDEMRRDKAILELQAESVSYVVLTHYGLPATHHATYLALWKANKEKIKQNLELISKVALFIIKQADMVAGKEDVTEEGFTGRMVQEMVDGLG